MQRYKGILARARSLGGNMVGIDCANLECKNPLCDCDPCMCTEKEPCLCCHMWDGESIVQSS